MTSLQEINAKRRNKYNKIQRTCPSRCYYKSLKQKLNYVNSVLSGIILLQLTHNEFRSSMNDKLFKLVDKHR